MSAARRVTAAIAVLSAFGPAARAQTVQGRVVQLPQETPIPGALVVLVDSTGRDVSHAASVKPPLALLAA